jgi:clan AA aspartic protease
VNGKVDEFGRALVHLKIRSTENDAESEISAWVDTAFNGELVMPASIIEAAGLKQSGGIRASLADGGEVTLETFACEVNWFGEDKLIEVIANDGAVPLLGVQLLIGHRLTVDYSEMTVTIE